MATVTFDTLKFVRTLKESGIPENQAEAITTAFKAATDEVDLVTKQDLMVAVKELEAKIATVETNLTRWIISAGVLQTVLIAALLLKLIK